MNISVGRNVMTKPYKVTMYDLAIVPLKKNQFPRSVKIECFDSEHEAKTFAESQSKNWDCVSVRKEGVDEVIVDFNRGIQNTPKGRT